MKCPKCGKRLKSIAPSSECEWLCDNPDCPLNKNSMYGAYAEFYGSTQKEVNEGFP